MTMSDERAELEARLKQIEQMEAEVARLKAKLTGTGALAQGEQAHAAYAENNSLAIAGDVKGNVYFGPAPQDEAEALRIYRRVLRHAAGKLPLRGVDIEASDPRAGKHPLNLVNVYIDLETTTPKLKGRSVNSEKFGAMEMVIKNSRLVLLGDPGGGKSTFVNHLTTCLAAHALEPEAGWLDHLNGWPVQEAEILPLLVVLRDFAQSLPQPLPAAVGPNILWEFITDRLKTQNLAFAASPLEKALEAGQALVLLDGLDEVPTLSQREFVRDAVWAFMERYRQSRYLITCRTLSYQPPAEDDDPDLRLPDEVPIAELTPFDEKRIDRFIAAWYAELVQLGSVRPEEQETLTRQLQQAVRRPDIWRLAPNPLLLTVIALVHTHKGRLPDARALLYEETVDLLLWRWEQIKVDDKRAAPPLRQLLLEAERTEMDLKKVLWQLAYEAHAKGAADDNQQTLAGIGQWTLLKELARLKDKDLDWAGRIIETIKLRAGLLLEREPEIFAFPHRTFQEYLAGAHLTVQANFAQQASQLAAKRDFWREVILLAVGRLVYLSGDTDKPLVLVSELCPSRPGPTETDWRKAWLAGEVMLEIGEKRASDSATGRDLLERVQRRLVALITGGHLTPRERAEAGHVLARLGDPRPEVMTVDGMEFCAVPPGPFMLGSGDDDDLAYPDEKPQHKFTINEGYWLSRYPVTVAQWREFVTASGHKPTAMDSLGDPANRPVRYVTWHEAVKFCAWLTEKWQAEGRLPAGWQVRLPREAEWEKAARGGLEILPQPVIRVESAEMASLTLPPLQPNPLPRRRYPWDNDPDPDRANYGETGIGATSAVGCFPGGASPYGVAEMSGNVWEWCATKWQDDYKEYQADNDLEGNDRRVVRGGAFRGSHQLVRCTVHSNNFPYFTYYDRGFRVMVSPFS